MSRKKTMQVTPITGKTRPRKPTDKLEAVWDELLSRQPERIRATFSTLDTPEQQAVVRHLQNMSSESGWQPEQRLSARIALRALEEQIK